MSFFVMVFYWVVIPALLVLTARWLLRRAKTPWHKGLIVAATVAAFAGLLWFAVGEKWLVDQQVRELCAKDGGVKVYEKVRLPAERFDKYNQIRIPSKQYAESGDEYFYEPSTYYIKNGDPEMLRIQFKVYRLFDSKLLGETTSYARRGGDVPGPWHDSSFGCPDNADITDLEKQIFIKAE